MATKISKWGNSLAIRVPHELVKKLGWREGTKVELSSEYGHIIIKREHKAKK